MKTHFNNSSDMMAQIYDYYFSKKLYLILIVSVREVNMLAGLLWMLRVEIMDHILYRSSIIGCSMDMLQMQPW